MSRLDGHIDGCAGDHFELVAVDGGVACAADDEPCSSRAHGADS
jgi:hypothetical protein